MFVSQPLPPDSFKIPSLNAKVAPKRTEKEVSQICWIPIGLDATLPVALAHAWSLQHQFANITSLIQDKIELATGPVDPVT